MMTSRLRRGGRRIASRLSELWSVLTSERSIQILTAAVLLFGGMLRLNRYLFNRSLFVDEANIALNVLGRDFAGLAQPLDYFQAAPFGWLLLIKLATIVLGSSEQALRFVPLVAGVAALALFYPLSRRYLTPVGSLIGCVLLATTDPAIQWSVMVKPYSMDLLVAVAILLIATRTDWHDLSYSNVVYVAALGGLAIWFSYTAVFVLAAVGLYALLRLRAPRRPRQLIALAIVGAVWLLSFAGMFAGTLQDIMQVDYLQDFWNPDFAPLPAPNLQAIDALFETFNSVFKDPVGVPAESGGSVLYLLGLVALLIRLPQEVVLLAGPILIAYFVSTARLYPFSDRLLLFSVPSFHLLIASGVERISAGVRRLGWLPVVALIGLLLYSPVRLGVSRGVHPRGYEEIRPVTEYVLEKFRPTDGLYIYYGAATPWQYYLGRYAATDIQYDLGTMARDNPGTYLEEVSSYQGRERVWFVFTHIYEGAAGNEELLILRRLRCVGTEIDSYRARDARAFLFDMRRPSRECDSR